MKPTKTDKAIIEAIPLNVFMTREQLAARISDKIGVTHDFALNKIRKYCSVIPRERLPTITARPMQHKFTRSTISWLKGRYKEQFKDNKNSKTEKFNKLLFSTAWV